MSENDTPQSRPPPIHPLAALFPMMTDDELDDLAADIYANGLLDPIVLDPTGVLLDGRNRLEACRRAGVEPTTTVYEGDVRAFVRSRNLGRRHLTWGQRALLVVLTEEQAESSTEDGAEESEPGGIIDTPRNNHELERITGIPRPWLVKARILVRYAPDRIQPVLEGKSFDDAVTTGRDRKAQETRDRADLARLRERAPDLAIAVTEERLALEGALTLLATREREHEARVREHSEHLAEAVNYAATLLSTDAMRHTIVELFDNSRSGVPFEVTKATLHEAAQNLLRLEEEWDATAP